MGPGESGRGARERLEEALSTPAEVRCSCAAAYGSSFAGLLLGDDFHPGGTELTRRLASALELKPGSRVLDVGGGPGTTAALLAGEMGVAVDVVDLAPTTPSGAGGVRATAADAERLPFRDRSFDAVVCECALSIVPDKAAAVSEWHRVLKSDGRAGLADVVVVRERLDPRLGSLVGQVACLGRALPEDEYVQLLRAAGFEVVAREDHGESLAALVETVRSRLVPLVATGLAAQLGMDLAAGVTLADLASDAIRTGSAGYVVLVAVKNGSTTGARRGRMR